MENIVQMILMYELYLSLPKTFTHDFCQLFSKLGFHCVTWSGVWAIWGYVEGRHWARLLWQFTLHIFKMCSGMLLADREGQGHWAVLYKSHFPTTKAFFSKWHQCIHRLINHIYIQRHSSFLFIAQQHGGSSDKTLRSQEY